MTATRTTTPVMAYVASCILTVSGGIFIYEILRNTDLTFSPTWNMFDSLLIWPLFITGILFMLAHWNAFSGFGGDPYEVITTWDGRKYVRRNWDIAEVLFAKVFLPFLGRFIIIPLMFSAAIYYPLMCVVWLVGSAFPYIISLLIVLTMVGAWLFALNPSVNEKLIVFVVGCLIFTSGYGVGSYLIDRNASPRQVETQVEDNTYNSPALDYSNTNVSGETMNDDDFE
ncbi:MAG: hypothetical protein J5900_02705 [Prevotella sp.]|nr:hypothetical protein [Prevotella sp.]